MKAITDQELRKLYNGLDHKGKFLLKASEKLKLKPGTIKLWFSQAMNTAPIPQDEKLRSYLKKELERSPKKYNL